MAGVAAVAQAQAATRSSARHGGSESARGPFNRTRHVGVTRRTGVAAYHYVGVQ
jgi:hypothetical protein